MKKKLVAVMLGLMMTIAMTGCGGCGAEEVAIETEATEVVEETEEVVEEIEVETEVETKEVTEEPTEVAEEPAEEVSPYSYTDLSQTLYAQSTVNVRDLPEQTGAKLGSLSTNQEVAVTGQCNETGWYRISYNGGEGFVSNSYLGSEKVVVKSSSSGTASSGGTSTQAEASVEEPASEPASDEWTGPTKTTEELMAEVDANTIHQDSYYCGFCDIEIADYNEYVTHMQAHGVQ